ncbi:MAG TPA: hypothetical protein VE398_22875 [Acidobacteriota bacterium]|nr:hypothetical protein [Acidobacteriota bacterium]
MVWLIRILIVGIPASLLAVLHHYSPLQLSSVVPYAGLLLVITGLICLIRPLKTIFVRSRKAAACLIAVGFFSAGLALFWPASTTTRSERTSLLDWAMPQYEFVEHHQIRVHAPLASAYSALQAVTPDELAAYPSLMKVRNAAMGRSWSKPKGPSPAIIAIFSDPSSGYMLIQKNEREMVFGGVGRVRKGDRPILSSPVAFASFDQRGCVKVAFNLKVDDAGNGWTMLSTETRLHAPDPESRRATAIYWRLIYPGSGMLRTMWLEAARTQAEKTQ